MAYKRWTELARRKFRLHTRQRQPFFHVNKHQRVENVQDIFHVSSFSSNSSSVTLAHERWGIWKRFYYGIPQHLMGCIPLHIWERRGVLCRWHISGTFVLRFPARRHLQWWTCTWPPDSTSKVVQLCVLVCLSCCLPSTAELLGQSVYVTQLDKRSTRNTFQVAAHSSPAF